MKKSFLYISILIFVAFILIGGWAFFGRSKNQDNTHAKVGDLKPVSNKEVTIPKVEKYDVPILMYHYIRDASGESEMGKNLSVHPDNFDAQLKWLKDNSYETVKISDLADPNKTTISKVYFEKKKPVVITFDDGYLDAYTNAFPALKKYNFIGVFYVIRGSVGKDDSFYMNQKQIDELEKAGNEIGSHTISHPDLTKISTDDARAQITDSKEKSQSFCFPAGRYNEETVELTKAAGYTTAVTTKIGVANQDSNLLELRRVRIEDVGPQAFKEKIEYAQEYGQ